MTGQSKGKKRNVATHITAAGVGALISFPLWKMATIGQSGWKTEGSMFYDRMLSAMKPPYKGVAATLFGMTWARASIFFFSEYMKPKMLADGYGQAAATSVPPLIMGTFAQVANMPLVRATITVQNPASPHANIFGAFREITEKQGARGLWHGTWPAVLKTVPKYIIAVAVKDWCEHNLAPEHEQMGFTVHQRELVRSAKKSVSAGVLGAALTNPFDVVRNEMFKTNEKAITVTRRLWEQDGPSFMIRGCGRNMISVAFPVALTIFLVDIFEDFSFLKGTETQSAN